MSDFVRSALYMSERTKNKDRGEFSGAPQAYFRMFVLEDGYFPKPWLGTEAMLREGFAIAERNPEDCGVWLPPHVPGPRNMETPARLSALLLVLAGVVGLGVGTLL